VGGKSSSVTVGYKHYVGMHAVLCHGPIDHVERLTVDERTAWTGFGTGGSITVDSEELFGGEAREGGVSGTIDIEMGDSAQTKNSYLLSKIGSAIPAYRGVVGLVFRQTYMGNNPYLKPWRARGQRIHTAQDGAEQWYDDTAAILVIPPGTEPYATYNFDIDATTDGGVGADEIRANGHSFTVNSVTDLVNINTNHAGAFTAYSVWGVPAASGGNTGSQHDVDVVKGPSTSTVTTFGAGGPHDGYAAARAAWEAAYPNGANVSGAGQYYIGIADTPIGDNSGGYSVTVQVYAGSWYDMNPAHIIRECLTNQDWGMGYSTADIDDTAFTEAADQLYAEGMGISVLWDKQISIDAFVGEIIRHIDGALYVSRTTGKFVLKLIRGGYDEGSLIELNESNVDNVSNPSRSAFGELVNSVTVQFWNGLTGKDDSVTVQDPAGVQQQGAVINTTIQYPGFSNLTIAATAASRDLRALSSPFLSCTVFAGEDARDLDIGDVFKLSWGKWNISNKIMRVIGFALGDGKSNQVRLTCVEDVFATPANIGQVVGNPGGGWTDPSTPPTALESGAELLFEVPYYELVQAQGQTDADSMITSNNDIAFLGAAAARPGSAINALLWTNAGAGYESVGNFDFAPSGTIDADIDKLDTAIVLENANDLDLVPIGSHGQIGDELIRVDAIDATTGAVTIGRGCLDTVPEAHLTGARVFFWDLYAGIDPTEYISSETIDGKITPISGAGQVSLAEANELELTMIGRAFLPYPPGNLTINGESYFDNTYSGELTIAWAHRSRTQQTSGSLADHFDGDIGPEAGQAYRLQGYINDVLVHTEDDIAGTSTTWTPVAAGDTVKVEVHSKRDSLYSWQAPSHSFIYGAPEVDEYFLWTHMLVDASGFPDGTTYATDQSRHAHAITYLNGAQVTSGKFELDGVNDALRIGVANDPIWAPANAATFEMFGVEFDGTGAESLASLYNADAADNRSWLFTYTGTQLRLSVYSAGTGSPSTTISYTWTPATDGTEYDLAWSWDGADLRLFIDGTCVAVQAYTGAWYRATSGSYLVIGGHYQSDSLLGSACFDGRFLAARFTRACRYAGAVSSTYTVPTVPLSVTQDDTVLDDPDFDKVMLLARVDATGKVYDASPFDWHMIPNSNAAGTTAVKPGDCDGSINLDGADDIYQIPDNQYLHFANDDFTLEAHVRFEALTTTRSIFSRYNANASTRCFYWAWQTTGPDELVWATWTNGSTANAQVVSGTYLPTLSTFYHLAITREGDDHRHFVDGTQSGSTDNQANTVYEAGSSNFWIGAIRSASSSSVDNELQGYITELRVTKGLARYTAGFTAPTGKLPTTV